MDLYTIGCKIESPIVWYIQKCRYVDMKNLFLFLFCLRHLFVNRSGYFDQVGSRSVFLFQSDPDQCESDQDPKYWFIVYVT